MWLMGVVQISGAMFSEFPGVRSQMTPWIGSYWREMTTSILDLSRLQ